MTASAGEHSEVMTPELVAVVVSIIDSVPHVLVSSHSAEGDLLRLPSGPLQTGHRSMQAGLRSWVEQQTGYQLGYVEQLYTFADPDRTGAGGRVISVSYLGLTRARPQHGRWVSWYDLFPWEDQRTQSEIVDADLSPALHAWAAQGDSDEEITERRQRCDVDFGLGDHAWVPDLVLQRYELLYEAGLVPESAHYESRELRTGEQMAFDHRRIVATGVARLRAKSQYRPVVFELMPEEFTLGQLQLVVEGITGQNAHKQNFRRFISQQKLVEETGATTRETGGRPARLFRFRPEVHVERHLAGTHVPVVKSR